MGATPRVNDPWLQIWNILPGCACVVFRGGFSNDNLHTLDNSCHHAHVVGGISVRCKTHLQVPDSRVQVWSQQSCLRRDKIQYFGKVLQNSPLTSHKMRLNRAILTMTLPCQYLSWGTWNRNYLLSAHI